MKQTIIALGMIALLFGINIITGYTVAFCYGLSKVCLYSGLILMLMPVILLAWSLSVIFIIAKSDA